MCPCGSNFQESIHRIVAFVPQILRKLSSLHPGKTQLRRVRKSGTVLGEKRKRGCVHQVRASEMASSAPAKPVVVWTSVCNHVM